MSVLGGFGSCICLQQAEQHDLQFVDAQPFACRVPGQQLLLLLGCAPPTHRAAGGQQERGPAAVVLLPSYVALQPT